MTTKIPATVVTGFLGAGKTTLIRICCANAKGRRLALIINEFGDVGVDGEILKGCRIEGCGEDENLIELANGCICCTVADDFLPTMATLLEPPIAARSHRDRDLRPGPAQAAGAGLQLARGAHPRDRRRRHRRGRRPGAAAGRFADDRTALAAQRAADPSLDHDSPIEELFEDQLNCADLVILNKIRSAGCDGARGRGAGDRRASCAPVRKVVPARFGAIDPGSCSASGPRPRTISPNRPAHHDAEGEHDHDDFESFHVALPRAAADREDSAGSGRRDDRAPRHPARQGLPRRRRQGACASCCRASATALQQLLRPRLGRRRRRGASRLVVIGLKGLDRRAIDRRARRGRRLSRCISSPPNREHPTAAPRPSISARRRATSSSSRPPTANWPAWPRRSDRLLGRMRRACGSPICCSSATTSRSTSMSRRSSATRSWSCCACWAAPRYWPYGIEQLAALCREHGIALAGLPGDDQPDPELTALYHGRRETATASGSYLRARAASTMPAISCAIAATLIGRDGAWREPRRCCAPASTGPGSSSEL